MTLEAPDHAHYGNGMRLAILGTRGIPARYGGFETFAEQLAVRLVERGHHVTVYAESDHPAKPDTIYRGVRIRHVVPPKWGSASVIAFDCLSLWDARSGHDVVYMLGYGAAWACWLPRSFGTPVWLNVDGLEWARSKWGRLARIYLRLMEWFSSWVPTRVIADAQGIANHYTNAYPRGVPCSFIAYGALQANAVDFNPAPLLTWGLAQQGYVLVVARAEPENHLLEMVQGFLMQACSWPLIVVGDVSGASAYQRQLVSLACDRVRFVGAIYDPELLMCLRVHSACYLHGHSVGGTNPSLLEALACGNLVLAHDNVFNQEVARDAAQYFRTPEQLAACIQAVFAMTPEQRQFQTSRAREIIDSHYTWDHITDQYERLMRVQLDAARSAQ